MIVLLTDFGESEYVGVMKGVIYGIARGATIVDLCHSISAQSIIEGSWVLKNSRRYFPKGAIFCCVVDPGVGTERRALAVQTSEYYFVGPDNGVFWEVVKEEGLVEMREIVVGAGVSSTFHGRDVFAKAAAQIELGGFEGLGPRVEEMEKLEFYRSGREGIIVRIDRFGNVVTNLPTGEKNRYVVEAAGGRYEMECYENYQAAAEGELFLIEGSCGTLEISMKGADANGRLNLRVGSRIKIE